MRAGLRAEAEAGAEAAAEVGTVAEAEAKGSGYVEKEAES